MADYAQSGNRWTMILLRVPQKDGSDHFKKVPFELVRFNVDTDPDAKAEIVPDGEADRTVVDNDKVYEKLWVVDQVPFSPGSDGKVHFGKVL